MPVVSTVTEHSSGRSGAGRLQRAACAEDGRLGLQQVLRGLHQQCVGAAGDHALGVLLVGVAQRRVRRRGPASAASCPGPSSPAPSAGGRRPRRTRPPRRGRSARPSRRARRSRSGMSYSAQRGVVGAEGVGLHAVHAGLEVGAVDGPHDVGAGHVQDLVAALELLEVLQRRVLRLNHRAHRPVRDHHALGERLTQGVLPAVSGRRRACCSARP